MDLQKLPTILTMKKTSKNANLYHLYNIYIYIYIYILKLIHHSRLILKQLPVKRILS